MKYETRRNPSRARHVLIREQIVAFVCARNDLEETKDASCITVASLKGEHGRRVIN